LPAFACILDINADGTGSPTQETVVVQNVVRTQVQLNAAVKYNHAEGSVIMLNAVPGNPGPSSNYNPLQDSTVVLQSKEQARARSR
jgi:hypothetical protein